MGVRFECPAGHKLNVKAELAGQRGICPQCGARFVVPSESGGRAPAAGSAAAVSSPPLKAGARGGTLDSANHNASVLTSAAAFVFPEDIPSASTPPAFAPPADELDEAAWYVRTAGGEQYGPAATETIQAWLAEGRVPDDGWVWRTGWAEWRPARDARRLLDSAASPPAPPAVTPPPAPAFGSDEFDAEIDWPTVDNSPAVAGGLLDLPAANPPKSRRRSTSGAMIVLLTVVAIGVLAAMVFVLTRDPTPAANDAPAPIEGGADLPAE